LLLDGIVTQKKLFRGKGALGCKESGLIPIYFFITIGHYPMLSSDSKVGNELRIRGFIEEGKIFCKKRSENIRLQHWLLLK
jgi:hypothetical protein